MNKTETADRIVAHVYETEDYSKFKFIEANRSISKRHLSKLRKAFAKIFIFIPFYVTRDFYLIDGQHRFWVCREMGLPIRYIFLEGAKPTVLMRIVNTFRMNWNWKAFLHMYCVEENEPYIKCRNFMDIFPEFNFSSVITMLTQKTNKGYKDYGKGNEVFKINNFIEGELNIPDYDQAVEIAKKILKFKQLFPWYNDNNFVSAMVSIFKDNNYNHDIMIAKLEVDKTLFEYRRTIGEYKYMISKAYHSSVGPNFDFMGSHRNFIMLGK